MTCTTCHDIYSTTGKALCSPTPQASCCSCFPSPVKWSRYRSRGMPSTCSNQQSSADIARKFRPGDDKHSHHYFSIFDKIWLFGPPTNSNTTQATLEKDNPRQTATQVCANRTWQNMRVLINITILFLLYIYIFKKDLALEHPAHTALEKHYQISSVRDFLFKHSPPATGGVGGGEGNRRGAHSRQMWLRGWVNEEKSVRRQSASKRLRFPGGHSNPVSGTCSGLLWQL